MCLPFLAAIPAAIGTAASAAASAVSSIGLGTVASLVGTGVSAAGSIMQGNAANAQAQAQADAENVQADNIKRQGDYEAARKRDQLNQVQGGQTALAAASGLSLEGSPSDVIASTASQGQLDVSAIHKNAYDSANNLNYQATLTRQQGAAAQQAGYIGAFTNTLGGISNAYSDWQKVQLQKKAYG